MVKKNRELRPMVSDKEKEPRLNDFNDTDAPFPDNKTLHDLFEAQVERTPGAPAIFFKNQQLSYRELNEKAGALACLLSGKGVGPGSIVGLMVDRSVEMMVGLMGILKAGAAYMPIDPHYPKERIDFMLKDSGAEILLTSPDISNCQLPMSSRIFRFHHPGNLAYVIYTSGSTGRPKGVMVEHRSVVNRLHWMQKRYPLDETDTILQKTPFIFDVSVWELFWWSLVGAAVCFLLPGFEKFPQAIVETVEKRRVTTMHFVPSMLSAFLGYIENSGDVKRLGSLKRVFVSGEALKPAHVELFNRTMYRENGTQLINLYGPTEATVDVSYFDCPPGGDIREIPIGKPIDNIRLYIMDSDSRLQPVGTEGELCISGVGLARGYLNRPEMTEERFINQGLFLKKPPLDPAKTFDKKAILTRNTNTNTLYRTGDLAYWLPDGNIVFVGRIDHQVKIRGLRIELGEIEAVLARHPGVQDCVVIVKETTETIITLAAYMVIKPGAEVTDQELKKHMKSFLPDYMVPGEWVRMGNLPRTPSGKVDRKKLIAEE
jgi:fengycin family lipopeptide synthetase D